MCGFAGILAFDSSVKNDFHKINDAAKAPTIKRA